MVDILQRMFQMHCTLIRIPLNVVLQNPVDNKSRSVGSGNGLAPNRRLADDLTDDQEQRRIHDSHSQGSSQTI